MAPVLAFPEGGDASRVECAWCKTILREGTEPISHGACEKCCETLRESLRAKVGK